MAHLRRLATVATLALLATGAVAQEAAAATGDGSPTDPDIAFVGRWDTRNAAAYLPAWAGAYLNKTGTVDLTPAKLASGRHTLRVSYRVVAGSYHGDAVFPGLILDSGASTPGTRRSPRAAPAW